MEIKNRTEFLNLIRRYETVSLKEIEDQWKELDANFGHEVARVLTGFGGSATCTLCKPILKNEMFPKCSHCMYKSNYGCVSGNSLSTYNKIEKAKNPETLLLAFRERAVYMKKLL